MNDIRRILRDALGYIVTALRHNRILGERIEKKVDAIGADIKELVKLAGGDNAKIQALREDFEALRDGKVADHERRIRKIADNLPPVASGGS